MKDKLPVLNCHNHHPFFRVVVVPHGDRAGYPSEVAHGRQKVIETIPDKYRHLPPYRKGPIDHLLQAGWKEGRIFSRTGSKGAKKKKG